MKLSRREALKIGLVGAGVALPLGAWAALGGRRASPRIEPFRVSLPVPPVLEPIRTDGDADEYEIVQQAGTSEILPGLATTVWGYNGIFPGPTIEARRGRTVVVRHRNELPVPVVVHLHGGVTPPEHDGYPTDLILPVGTEPGDFAAHAGHELDSGAIGGERTYVYPNDQPAATLWYHDHRIDFTGPQVYRGLAGLYLLRDEVEDALPLPRGDKEVPLVIADRLFGEDGSFLYPSLDPSLRTTPGVETDYGDGVNGDVILVNGAPWPVLEVANVRYRFRILNASNARVYELALDPPAEEAPLVQIGSDGGLLAAPVAHRSVRVAPGERFDIVVDFSRYQGGTEVTLRNLRAQSIFGDGPTANIMRFRVVREEKEESTVPAMLAPVEELPHPDPAEVTRRFEFRKRNGMWTINEEAFDPERILVNPRLGATEIWEFTGSNGHPVHLHLAHVRVLSRNGREPERTDAGWKDTVFLGDDVRVVGRFGPYRGKYVLHCHNLEHEDMMMMANFEVS